MHIAMDFDGVLHEYTGWTGPEPTGGVLSEGHTLLFTLNDAGHQVDLFTTRPAFMVWRWLEKHDLLSLVQDVTDYKKASYSVFIDDRAIRFNGSAEEAIAAVRAFEQKRLPWWKAGV